MPVYEYRCLDCEDVFERRWAIGDADAARCPEGHDRVKRLLSMFAVGSRPGPAASAGGCCGGACSCG